MNVSRRDSLWLINATVVIGYIILSLASDGLAVVRRPNVVYLFADQWRAAATGYSGDPNVKTPNLDKLVTKSVNFGNAVSVCPVCTPYRASLMTGRYPTSTGMFMNDLYLPDQELCMGEIFKAAGYSTAYIGKWHLDGHGRSSYIPIERRQGFEYWKAGECDHNYMKSHYYSGTSAEKKFWEGYDAFAQTRDARQYIHDHAKDGKPFLLVVSYGVPHFPHNTAPKEYAEMYPPEKLILAPNVDKNMELNFRKELSGYYAHCSALDKCIGEMVQTLQEAGLADNTILVFTSDHGEMMGAQHIAPRTKQYPFDEACRVPFLLCYPDGQGKGIRSIREPINTPDILPTLLGLAGVAIPKTVEGKDLSALVKGTARMPERAVLIMSVSPFVSGSNLCEYRGIRTYRYTYVKNLSGVWLLYDNQEDPWQLNNLAGKPGHETLQKELNEKLITELKKIGDEFKPRKFYLDKWGYKVDEGGQIPYDGNAEVQGPQWKEPGRINK